MAWVGLAAVLAHTFMIAAWVGPSTPVRQAVGNDTLRAYVEPVFEQSWQIFAPTPRRVAVNLQVRAEYLDPASGDPVQTGWVDLVDGEDALIAGNPFPPRMSLAARRVANTLNASMDDMGETQVELVAGNYLTTPVATLGARLVDAAEGETSAGAVRRYLTHDEAATRLATLYWTYALGDDVESVQYRTGQRYVPTYDPASGAGDIDAATVTWFDYGWRAAPAVSDAEVQLFAPYLRMGGSA